MFRLFLNGKAFQSDEKEMDFIVLFGAYEIYVNLEVKAEEKNLAKTVGKRAEVLSGSTICHGE